MPGKTMPFPRENVDLGDCNLPLYSPEHLTYQNIMVSLSAQELAKRAAEMAARNPDDRLMADVAARLASHAGTDDRNLIRRAVASGHGRGLAAAWGCAPDAMVLWAAAALLMLENGLSHPDD